MSTASEHAEPESLERSRLTKWGRLVGLIATTVALFATFIGLRLFITSHVPWEDMERAALESIPPGFSNPTEVDHTGSGFGFFGDHPVLTALVMRASGTEFSCDDVRAHTAAIGDPHPPGQSACGSGASVEKQTPIWERFLSWDAHYSVFLTLDPDTGRLQVSVYE